MCGRLREKEVKVFSGDEEGVLQRVEKKEGVTGLFRGEGLRCSRTYQGPESMLLNRSGLPMASSVSGFMSHPRRGFWSVQGCLLRSKADLL